MSISPAAVGVPTGPVRGSTSVYFYFLVNVRLNLTGYRYTMMASKLYVASRPL